ncbi:hypothetical protein PR048_005496 [Dryococelus australis]|uniref:Uncharacterized protein n=1 Tax=Dryococelus australis TaxID=614101 RepID=A0ABQ9I9J4_9NEOP|nr:hypothetical protein PR048_005496 [Dryococelus australis]
MVEIVLLYVRAELVGDWNLRLFCLQSMLPYFHTTGHLNYAKIAHIYLQRMDRISESSPMKELEQFVGKSYFTLKRTDKFWSRTSADMIIEQYLMCSMNYTGGLTFGRASSAVNYDSTKDAEISVMKAMVGNPFSGITLKRKDVVTTLSKATKGIQLFHRMLCMLRSGEELPENLSYELSAWPLALFENCNMRKGSGKAALLPVLENHIKLSFDFPNK